MKSLMYLDSRSSSKLLPKSYCLFECSFYCRLHLNFDFRTRYQNIEMFLACFNKFYGVV